MTVPLPGFVYLEATGQCEQALLGVERGIEALVHRRRPQAIGNPAQLVVVAARQGQQRVDVEAVAALPAGEQVQRHIGGVQRAGIVAVVHLALAVDHRGTQVRGCAGAPVEADRQRLAVLVETVLITAALAFVVVQASVDEHRPVGADAFVARQVQRHHRSVRLHQRCEARARRTHGHRQAGGAPETGTVDRDGHVVAGDRRQRTAHHGVAARIGAEGIADEGVAVVLQACAQAIAGEAERADCPRVFQLRPARSELDQPLDRRVLRLRRAAQGEQQGTEKDLLLIHRVSFVGPGSRHRHAPVQAAQCKPA